MRILVSGSAGFIGSALVSALQADGQEVVRLVRSAPQPGEAAVQWNPAWGFLDATRLPAVDAVINLAGESIVALRYSAEKLRRIRESRVRSARLLAETLSRLPHPPAVLVSASAVGYYGDRGDELLDEESAPGNGFFAEVCRAWEAALAPAAERGIRVVALRSGIVLDPSGGFLGRLLRPLRWGFGGRLGSGKQYMSWITREDLVGSVRHVLAAGSLAGPVNAVAPQPVTNAEFTRTLARVVSRPAFVGVPFPLLRLALGRMAAEMIASARVRPSRLLATGYAFRDPDLEGALRRLLGS